MGGVCERPGCSRIAAAAVAADPRRQIVWIGDLETSAESVNSMCAFHADNLAVPVGWERRDVRDAPRLFAVPAVAGQAGEPKADRPGTIDPPPAPRRRRSRKAASTEAVVVAQTLDTIGGGSGAATTASAQLGGLHLGELHRGTAELSAATTALLDVGVDTPLLARAFRTARAAG